MEGLTQSNSGIWDLTSTIAKTTPGVKGAQPTKNQDALGVNANLSIFYHLVFQGQRKFSIIPHILSYYVKAKRRWKIYSQYILVNSTLPVIERKSTFSRGAT